MNDALRLARLENDYKQMLNLRGRMITWEIARGRAPYVEEYLLHLNVRTIIGPKPVYRDQHDVRIVLPREYPRHAPLTYMVTKPQPYHPNWYASDARWCYGTWSMAESLAQYVLRMVRSLQYDREITNELSPANAVANQWYMRHKDSGLFPCDTQALPSPEREKLTFVIRNMNP